MNSYPPPHRVGIQKTYKNMTLSRFAGACPGIATTKTLSSVSSRSCFFGVIVVRTESKQAANFQDKSDQS